MTAVEMKGPKNLVVRVKMIGKKSNSTVINMHFIHWAMMKKFLHAGGYSEVSCFGSVQS